MKILYRLHIEISASFDALNHARMNHPGKIFITEQKHNSGLQIASRQFK